MSRMRRVKTLTSSHEDMLTYFEDAKLKITKYEDAKLPVLTSNTYRKAPNSSPQGNFPRFLARFVGPFGESCHKNTRKQICSSKLVRKLPFPSLFCWPRSDFSKPL